MTIESEYPPPRGRKDDIPRVLLIGVPAGRTARTPSRTREHDSLAGDHPTRGENQLPVRLLLCLPVARIEHSAKDHPLAEGAVAPADALLPTELPLLPAEIHVDVLPGHRWAAWRTTLAASIPAL